MKRTRLFAILPEQEYGTVNDGVCARVKYTNFIVQSSFITLKLFVGYLTNDGCF